jgi:hypothetical protein
VNDFLQQHEPQNGFDGDELLSFPGIALVTVNADVIRQAEMLIETCEHPVQVTPKFRSIASSIALFATMRLWLGRACCGGI